MHQGKYAIIFKVKCAENCQKYALNMQYQICKKYAQICKWEIHPYPKICIICMSELHAFAESLFSPVVVIMHNLPESVHFASELCVLSLVQRRGALPDRQKEPKLHLALTMIKFFFSQFSTFAHFSYKSPRWVSFCPENHPSQSPGDFSELEVQPTPPVRQGPGLGASVRVTGM